MKSEDTEALVAADNDSLTTAPISNLSSWPDSCFPASPWLTNLVEVWPEQQHGLN